MINAAFLGGRWRMALYPVSIQQGVVDVQRHEGWKQSKRCKAQVMVDAVSLLFNTLGQCFKSMPCKCMKITHPGSLVVYVAVLVGKSQ